MVEPLPAFAQLRLHYRRVMLARGGGCLVLLVSLCEETAEGDALLNHSTLVGVAGKTVTCKKNKKCIKGEKCMFTDLCKRDPVAFS